LASELNSCWRFLLIKTFPWA